MEFEEEKVKSDGDELCGLIELAIAERNRMKLHKHISDMLAIDADHEILPLAKEYMRAFAVRFHTILKDTHELNGIQFLLCYLYAFFTYDLLCVHRLWAKSNWH